MKIHRMSFRAGPDVSAQLTYTTADGEEGFRQRPRRNQFKRWAADELITARAGATSGGADAADARGRSPHCCTGR